MRASIVDSQKFVTNVIEVDSLNFLPGLISGGNMGDYWTGTEFISIYDPRHPHYVPPVQS